ncbi:MAG: sigma-70 family RNA polymerase sigma factor [Ekhidna sp.]
MQPIIARCSGRVTGSTADAEDILQSVFLRLLQRPEGADCGVNLAGYLCRSAINAGIDLLRSRARAPGEALIEEMHSSEDGADDEARQAEIRRHLRRAMLELEPGGKKVTEGLFIDQLPFAADPVQLDPMAFPFCAQSAP